MQEWVFVAAGLMMYISVVIEILFLMMPIHLVIWFFVSAINSIPFLSLICCFCGWMIWL